MTQVFEKPANMLAETEITLEMIEAGLRAPLHDSHFDPEDAEVTAIFRR